MIHELREGIYFIFPKRTAHVTDDLYYRAIVHESSSCLYNKSEDYDDDNFVQCIRSKSYSNQNKPTRILSREIKIVRNLKNKSNLKFTKTLSQKSIGLRI